MPDKPAGSESPASQTHKDAATGQGLSPVRVAAGDTSQHAFGANLEPVLREACSGRLSVVTWFRADWQRGGALTGYATYRDDGGRDQPVVVKLPIGPVERQWLVRLSSALDVSPGVYADGLTLGGYDMAWVVMERLPYGPLGLAWGAGAFDLLVEAVGRFYAATSEYRVNHAVSTTDWEQVLQRSRESVRRHGLANEQRWGRALKKANRKLKDWLSVWDDRPVDQWCHGDLHLANAMSRVAPPGGPAILLDFALMRPGHWVEDAVYFEHLYWSRRDRLDGRKVCKQIANQRKELGLPLVKDWSNFAKVARALYSMGTPASLSRGGDPQHVQAALEVLEAAVSGK